MPWVRSHRSKQGNWVTVLSGEGPLIADEVMPDLLLKLPRTVYVNDTPHQIRPGMFQILLDARTSRQVKTLRIHWHRLRDAFPFLDKGNVLAVRCSGKAKGQHRLKYDLSENDVLLDVGSAYYAELGSD